MDQKLLIERLKANPVVAEELRNNVVRLAAEKFTVQEMEGGGTRVVGKALPVEQVSRNGFHYITESVAEAAPTLKGCSVLFNHREDVVIGHVKDSPFNPQSGLQYENDINPEAVNKETGVKFVDSIRRGDLSKVSIKCSYDPERSTYDEEKGVVSAWVTEFIEISHVSTPGFVDTSAAVVESFRAASQKSHSQPSEGVKNSPTVNTMPKANKPQSKESDEEKDPMQEMVDRLNEVTAQLQEVSARVAKLESGDGEDDDAEEADDTPEDKDKKEDPAEGEGEDDKEDDKASEEDDAKDDEEDQKKAEEAMRKKATVPSGHVKSESASNKPLTEKTLKEAITEIVSTKSRYANQ
jgi:phage head maturation protease